LRHLGTVILETDRLILRRFTAEDTDAMFRNWASNPHVTRCLVWAAHKTPEETRQVLCSWVREYRNKDFYEWAVVPKELGFPVGSIGLVECADDPRRSEAGYCLGEPWWNHGYATEALRAVLDFGLNVVGYRAVIAKHAMENPASGRVMQKAGMTMRVGEILPVSTANGLFDCIVYEMTQPRKKGLFGRSRKPAAFYRIRTT
jgi:ribosomal-protein-alanine N-acetyltransferase